MAGKAPVMASRRLHYALDKLSKNALIDLVIDLACKDIGQEDASDNQLADTIQGWIDPVLRVRSDRPVSLRGAFAALEANDEAYQARYRPHPCKGGCGKTVTGADLCTDCSDVGRRFRNV